MDAILCGFVGFAEDKKDRHFRLSLSGISVLLVMRLR